MSFNAFLNFDQGTGLDRSLEFNENNKANPSAVATAELGPWTRATSQWTAERDADVERGRGRQLRRHALPAEPPVRILVDTDGPRTCT